MARAFCHSSNLSDSRFYASVVRPLSRKIYICRPHLKRNHLTPVVCASKRLPNRSYIMELLVSSSGSVSDAPLLWLAWLTWGDGGGGGIDGHFPRDERTSFDEEKRPGPRWLVRSRLWLRPCPCSCPLSWPLELFFLELLELPLLKLLTEYDRILPESE